MIRWLQLAPGDWQKLSALLDTALELAPEARAQWLDTLGDSDLINRLRSILARSASVETDDFLGALPHMSATDVELAALNPMVETAGDRVGAYRLVRELGRGGMSTVWLAERIDGLIRRPVALKLPQGIWRRGVLAERFARERNILAALTHPNIARLYDAGIAANGQPYLSIEYVEGQPLDAYCAAVQAGLRERLRLFVNVARAVAYAHTQLIVHRDLKPANILVTAAGEVRLLDFGVAKLLDPEQAGDAQQTELAAQAFTPDYAAPEQIAGEPISTATDVYSLGVVLYELISQTRPYKLSRGTRAALEQAISQVEPARPSAAGGPVAWHKMLRGDLDTIALKALKKNPNERYSTVGALADDLERYLEHRPVLARPDTLRYRLSKFVRRNRLQVASLGVVLVAILAGATISIWQARIARAEARRAAEIQEFLASTIRDVDLYENEGRILSAADLLLQAYRRAETLNERPELQVETLTLIAESLRSLLDLENSEKAAHQALDVGTRLLGPEHERTLRARMVMVDVHRYRGRTDDMRRELDHVERTLSARSHIEPVDRYFLLNRRAHLWIDTGEFAQASSAALAAYTLAQQVFGERDTRTAIAAASLAFSYQYADVLPEVALDAAERAWRLNESLHGANLEHPHVIDARTIYGLALGKAGHPDLSVQHLEAVLAHESRVYGMESLRVGHRRAHIAQYQTRLGRLKPAIDNLDSSLQIFAPHVQRDSFTYLSALRYRGAAHLSARNAAKALPDIDECLRAFVTMFGSENPNTAATRRRRAQALGYLGRFGEARAELGPVLELYRSKLRDPLRLPSATFIVAGHVERLAGDPSAAREFLNEAMSMIGSGRNAEWMRADALAEIGLAELDLAGSQTATALAYLQEADVLQQQLQQGGPTRADVLLGLGRAHLSLGSTAVALEFLRQADEFWQDFDPTNRWAGEAGAWYALGLEAAGQHRRAREVASRAQIVLRESPLRIDVKLLRSLP